MNLEFNIYVTLISTFGIILIGYFFGRCKVITAAQGKGISLYMVNLALPVLIFKALVTVDFKSINWLLWTGILLAKAFVFVVVVVLTIVFQKEDKLGKAGLYGIFVTQSNDFAFGLPIMESIFNSSSCRYLVNYIYLVAPISLALLNPIAYSMMEYEKAKKDITCNLNLPSSSSHEVKRISILKKTVLTTIKGIVTNPLVFMIVLGVIFNYIFHQRIPALLSLFVDNVASSFGATALFYLGWSLGSKATLPRGLSYLLPVVLVVTKGLILPLIMKVTVSWMVRDEIIHNTTLHGNGTLSDQATFGFIYGSIPTAPTVIVFAGIYGLNEDVIASGLVFGTVLFAPILFASVQVMRVLSMTNMKEFCLLANVIAKDVSILNVICCIWVLCVFAILRLYKRTLHRYTIGLICFQLLIGLHGFFYSMYINIVNVVAKRVLYWFLMTTMFGYCTWSVVTAISVGFLSSSRKMAYYLIPFGIITPLLLATIMILVYPDIVVQSSSPYFMLFCEKKDTGSGEISITLNILVFLSILVCLIKINKSNIFENLFAKKFPGKRNAKTPLLKESIESMAEGSTCHSRDNSCLNSEAYCIVKQYYSCGKQCDMEDCSSSLIDDIHEAEQSELTINGYVSKQHCANHLILVLLLGFVSLVNLSAGLWYFVSSGMEGNGLFLGLQMLGVILTFGQGFFTFMTFGFLKELFLLPFFEQFYNCFGVLKKRPIHLPNIEDLNSDVIVTCNHFIDNHYNKCFNDIVKNLCLRVRGDMNAEIFKGTALVDWLVNSNVSDDRGEAVAYANKLLLGRVIRHVNDEHFFYDLPYFYKFTNVDIE